MNICFWLCVVVYCWHDCTFTIKSYFDEFNIRSNSDNRSVNLWTMYVCTYVCMYVCMYGECLVLTEIDNIIRNILICNNWAEVHLNMLQRLLKVICRYEELFLSLMIRWVVLGSLLDHLGLNTGRGNGIFLFTLKFMVGRTPAWIKTRCLWHDAKKEAQLKGMRLWKPLQTSQSHDAFH
jgi:hypothetical protein